MNPTAKRVPSGPEVRAFVASGPPEVTGDGSHIPFHGVAEIMASACWLLHRDGRLLFAADPALVRDDLHPVPGRWRTGAGGALLLDVARAVPEGPAIRITGRIEGNALVAEEHLRTASGVRKVTVRTPVEQVAVIPSSRRERIGGTGVPVTFRGTIEGTVDGRAFGPLDAALALAPRTPQAAGPVELHFGTADQGAVGSLMWLAGTAGPTPEDTGHHVMRLDGGRIRVDVDSPAGPAFAVSWQVPGPYGTLPVAARTASLEILVGDGTAEGTVVASGSAMGDRHAYTARFAVAADSEPESDPLARFTRNWIDPGDVDDKPPAVPETGDWRELRDHGFDLTLAGYHAEAVPVLERALAGCREDRGRPHHWSAFSEGMHIDELNILTRLLHCRRRDPGVEAVLPLLSQATRIRAELARREHLAVVLRSQTHLMTTLADQLEFWRGRLADEAERVDLATRSAGFLASLTALMIDLDDPRAALVVAERGRARALADVLAARRREPDDPVRLPRGDPEPERDVSTEDDPGDSSGTGGPAMPTGPAGPPEAARLRWGDTGSGSVVEPSEAVRLPRGSGQVSGSFGLGRLPTADPQTLPDLLRLVRENGLPVVEYQVGEDSVHALTVTPAGEVTAHRLAGPEELVPLVERARDLLTSPQPNRDLLEAILEDLYRQLIDPIPEFAESSGPVAIVPHAILFAVPFAALPNPVGGRAFGERRPVTILPSIGTLRFIGSATPASDRPRRLLALLDPDMPDPALAGLSELRAVLAVVADGYPGGATVLTGEEATAAALITHAPRHDVVLLGTHGYGDGSEPERSYVALAPDRRHSGFLRVAEVSRLRLDTELVLLVACQTAKGRITGDGVLGISRAVLQAGAGALIATLWPVAQGVTGELIYLFHDHWLRRGLTKVAALAAAQRDITVRYPRQPNLWGAFQLIGSWR
ncbi:CHAT domain-containing protein [Rhizohabitans arisaemae]|uniref:CHAT domain-containing protein n=1 Tax=Rhizohabitans arisaemae TaxID=2720610 RepID=UPI0024B05220|nr:CHAT domain-containing protein [Rhizohabitans arisaemae]